MMCVAVLFLTLGGFSMKCVDENISPFWQRDDGLVVRYNPDHGKWYELNGECAWLRVQSGNWMPWTPPKFPVRRKMPFRLCRVALHGGGGEWLASFRTDGRTYPFSLPVGDYKPTQVTVVSWLSPEYEDELGATDAQPASR